MQKGIYCKDEYVKFDGFYWQKKAHNQKYRTKFYYVQVFFNSEPNKFKEFYLHRYVWSLYNGPIPDRDEKGQKLIVHHINEDEFDNTIQNLDLITRGEHNRITRQNLKKIRPDAYKMPPKSKEEKDHLSKVMKGRKPTKDTIRKQQESKKLKKIKEIEKKIGSSEAKP